jgi:hypothetical protein
MFGLNVCLTAQAPGYLGKRIFIKPDMAYAPAFSNPTASNRGGNTYGEQGYRLGLNTKYGLQAGYAFSRRRVLAVEANYMATGMSLTAYTPSTLYDGRSDEHYLFYNLRGPEFGIALQTYNPLRGSIAPMGFFTAWRLRMALLDGEILDKRTTYFQSDASTGHLPLGIRPRYNQLTVGFELGQNVIVADKIVLSISAECNIPPLNFNLEPSYDFSEKDNQALFEEAAAARMRFHSFILFKIGLGYLF